MAFTVTYRGADGALREEVVEAAGRSECLAKFKARGIVPVSVKEGGRKGGGKNAAAREGAGAKMAAQGGGKNAAARNGGGAKRAAILAAAVLLAAVLGGAWWWLASRENARPEEPKAPRAAKVVKEVKEAKAPKAHTNAPAAKPAAPEPAPPKSAPPPKDMTREERAELLLKKIEERPPDLTPSSNKVFRTALEMTIAGIFTCPLGKVPPPLPRIPLNEEVHLEAILNAPNVVLETDSEKAAYAKKAVELAKKELKDYVAKGGDPQEFLAYYHGQLRQAQMEYAESQRQVMLSLKEDPELGAAMLREVNKRLEAKGIMPVVLPQHLKERYGIE